MFRMFGSSSGAISRAILIGIVLLRNFSPTTMEPISGMIAQVNGFIQSFLGPRTNGEGLPFMGLLPLALATFILRGQARRAVTQYALTSQLGPIGAFIPLIVSGSIGGGRRTRRRFTGRRSFRRGRRR
jgi:hypothetical protein